MKWLLLRRFSYIDTVWVTAVAILFSQQRFITAVVVAVLGTLFTLIVEAVVKKRTPVTEAWHVYASAGDKTNAVREHRMQYGSSLFEALNAVHDYMGIPRRQ